MRTTLFLFCMILLANGYAQDIEIKEYASRWQTRPSFGVNIPLTKLIGDGDEITDNLFMYDDHSTYVQIINASFFLRGRWGFDFAYQHCSAARIDNTDKDFVEGITSEYQDRFFITDVTTPTEYGVPGVWSDVGRALFGVIYRYESKRFFVYPKMSIGLTEFYINDAGMTLKEKGTNFYSTVNYSDPESSYYRRGFFLVAPSVIGGYKLSRRFFVNTEVMTSWFRVKADIEKSTTELYTNTSTIETTTYKADVFTLSWSVGLTYVFGRQY